MDPRARADLRSLPQSQARRISRAIDALAGAGGGDVTKLQGQPDRWRLRVGDWRVLFTRHGARIRIDRIANRRDAYR